MDSKVFTIASMMDPERKLDWLWDECVNCLGTGIDLRDANGVIVSKPEQDCPTCQGKGQIPHINEGNILRVEAWFWRQKELCSQQMFRLAWYRFDTLLRVRIRENLQDIPARVQGSIDIIYAAIEAAKENQCSTV